MKIGDRITYIRQGVCFGRIAYMKGGWVGLADGQRVAIGRIIAVNSILVDKSMLRPSRGRQTLYFEFS